MFVVYHVASTQEHLAVYTTLSGAKRGATALNKQFGAGKYAATDRADYESNVVKKVMVKNLMTGKLVEQESNTPHCCDVSSETYWSM
jgi:hypothetical protein